MAHVEEVAVSDSSSSDDDDDLWSYARQDDESAAAAAATAAIPEDDDDLDIYLSEQKRAKLTLEQRRRNRKRPANSDDEVVLLSDDEESGQRGKTHHPGAGPLHGMLDGDDDDAFDLPVPVQAPPQRTITDPAIAEMIRRNREAMASLERASMEATVTMGDLESDDDEPKIKENTAAVSPSPSRQKIAHQREEPAAEKLLLCLRCGEKKEMKLRMAKTDPFQKLMAAFKAQAIQKGWMLEGAAVKFVFDGETVPPNATPSSLDCEDDDVIDVHC